MLFFHVLFWLLVGNACVETVKHRSVNQPDSSFAGVVKRLAVLEDKERQNDEIIAAFKEEVLNLKQKAMDDHQTILRLNRELKGNKSMYENFFLTNDN